MTPTPRHLTGLSPAIASAVVAVLCCLGLAAPSYAGPTQDAETAIGAGDGATGARIIAANGYNTKPQVLAEIIYGAGVIAVRNGQGDPFSKAVAQAFVDGGVTFTTANQAFVDAATLVAAQAPGDKQLLYELGPGGVAILRTELAYFSVYLPSVPLI